MSSAKILCSVRACLYLLVSLCGSRIFVSNFPCAFARANSCPSMEDAGNTFNESVAKHVQNTLFFCFLCIVIGAAFKAACAKLAAESYNCNRCCDLHISTSFFCAAAQNPAALFLTCKTIKDQLQGVKLNFFTGSVLAHA